MRVSRKLADCGRRFRAHPVLAAMSSFGRPRPRQEQENPGDERRREAGETEDDPELVERPRLDHEQGPEDEDEQRDGREDAVREPTGLLEHPLSAIRSPTCAKRLPVIVSAIPPPTQITTPAMCPARRTS